MKNKYKEISILLSIDIIAAYEIAKEMPSTALNELKDLKLKRDRLISEINYRKERIKNIESSISSDDYTDFEFQQIATVMALDIDMLENIAEHTPEYAFKLLEKIVDNRKRLLEEESYRNCRFNSSKARILKSQVV